MLDHCLYVLATDVHQLVRLLFISMTFCYSYCVIFNLDILGIDGVGGTRFDQYRTGDAARLGLALIMVGDQAE